MSFEKEFAKESGNAIKTVEETTRLMAIELFSGVIASSPVGAPETWKDPNGAPKGYTGGSFRSNWFLTFTTPSTQTRKSTDFADKSKDEIAADVTTRIATQRGGGNAQKYILTNNLPYAERIENGWSSQRPAGVIAPNVSRVNALIPKIEKAANRKYNV